MKSNRIIIGLALLLLTVLLLWLWRNGSEPMPSKPEADVSPSRQSVVQPTPAILEEAEQHDQEKRRSLVGRIETMLNTPITFYGKVVDQNDEPVPNAKVEYGLLDKFNESGSVGKSAADGNGYFTISGARGAVISVSVHKERYYHIQDVSNQAFGYGYGPDSYVKPPPTKDEPAIFVLHKMGETEPLVLVSSRQIDVPLTGQPISIDLATGRTGQGNMQVTSWIGDSKQRPFDWRYQLSIPGGGLIERTGQFDFDSPADGYQPTIVVNMPANAEQWTARLTKEYFAKLKDGKYARFSVRFYAGERNFVVLESYVNPTPGSRNLEYDPAKRIQ